MTDTLLVRAWPDPIIDTLGHDSRSLYVETYYLPALGPTSLLLLRHLADRLDRAPGGFEVSLTETAQALGLGCRTGHSSPLGRSFERLVQFDLAREPIDDGGGVEVRRYVPPVNRRHVRRLPVPLQATHDAWVEARLAEDPLSAMRRNARRYAATLVETGDDPEIAERRLFASGFHPSVCREAALWAWRRRHHGEACA